MTPGKFAEQIEFIERMRLLGAIKIKVDTVEVEFKQDVIERVDPERLIQGIERVVKDNNTKELDEETMFWSS